MGNLMTYVASFDWSDTNIDRNQDVEDLNGVLILANDWDDLYYHPDLHENNLNFFTLLWKRDYERFQEAYPWINQRAYQALTNFANYFRPAPGGTNNLITLAETTGVDNNGWIGLKIVCPEYLVYDRETWFEFHNQYVSTFSRDQRVEKLEYFIKFYVANLNAITVNNINTLIQQGQVNGLIERVDDPHTDPQGNILHGEQIHVHFYDARESALNIDGTWKHGGIDTLPNNVCDLLIEWGFILPENRN